MWDFWRRHKRKVYVTLGVFGSGYLLFKLYDARKRRLHELKKQLADDRENEELIKAQIQVHFESVQRIADSTTLPHVMNLLDIRLAENLDLTQFTERLIQGKGQPNTLSTAEKLELWDRLKTLSFTKLVCSLWAMTMLSLYIRVQVNILGRHLYIDTARGLGSSHLLDEAELIDRNDEQQFLACADYLSNYGLLALISNTEVATTEVLKGKQLKDVFNVPVLRDTIIHILDTLMSNGSPRHWVGYLMPEDAGVYKFVAPSSSTSSDISHATKFELLMGETREVLSSAEFGNIVDISLRSVVDGVLEDVIRENNLISGMPLAKLLAPIAQTGQLLLKESNRSKYIQTMRNIPEVEVFFTLLYSTSTAMPIPSDRSFR